LLLHHDVSPERTGSLIQFQSTFELIRPGTGAFQREGPPHVSHSKLWQAKAMNSGGTNTHPPGARVLFKRSSFSWALGIVSHSGDGTCGTTARTESFQSQDDHRLSSEGGFMSSKKQPRSLHGNETEQKSGLSRHYREIGIKAVAATTRKGERCLASNP
jgi:hypothetical protein